MIADETAGDEEAAVTVDARVRVYPGTENESLGVVIDDFGDSAGRAVYVGDTRIAHPARRWAVQLDSGGIVFVDDDDLALE